VIRFDQIFIKHNYPNQEFIDFGKDRVAVLDDRSGEVTYNGNNTLYKFE
jgi:hypothetical protein